MVLSKVYTDRPCREYCRYTIIMCVKTVLYIKFLFAYMLTAMHQSNFKFQLVTVFSLKCDRHFGFI